MFFKLSPFENSHHQYEITSLVEIDKDLISFSFQISGNLDQIIFPAKPQDKNKLWEETCFEIFLLEKNNHYFEINMAPSLEHNIYYFSKYRKQDISFPHKRISISNLEYHNGHFRGYLKGQLNYPTHNLKKINLCCVIQEVSGRFAYWAIQHGSHKPDFHQTKHYISIDRL